MTVYYLLLACVLLVMGTIFGFFLYGTWKEETMISAKTEKSDKPQNGIEAKEEAEI